MKTITLQEALPYSADLVWSIFNDTTRCDWVPAVDEITQVDDVRSFTMEGIGEVQERILLNDSDARRLQYSAIKTPSGIEHHLATIQIESDGDQCILNWTTEIQPDAYAEAIEGAMKISLDGLKAVLAN